MRNNDRSVLVADDDDEFREAVAEVIEMDGWHVWQARDGDEAVQCALECNPDVVLLDHRMPAMTGVEVVRRLRQESMATPVVFVTAAYDASDLAASVGINCHLRKPFGFDELREMLNRAADGRCV